MAKEQTLMGKDCILYISFKCLKKKNIQCLVLFLNDCLTYSLTHVLTPQNSLNMGLSWVVQSVFSRLPFLNQRPASANASGDMSVGHLGQ